MLIGEVGKSCTPFFFWTILIFIVDGQILFFYFVSIQTLESLFIFIFIYFAVNEPYFWGLAFCGSLLSFLVLLYFLHNLKIVTIVFHTKGDFTVIRLFTNRLTQFFTRFINDSIIWDLSNLLWLFLSKKFLTGFKLNDCFKFFQV